MRKGGVEREKKRRIECGGRKGGIKGILDERRVCMGEMKGILTDKEGEGPGAGHRQKIR